MAALCASIGFTLLTDSAAGIMLTLRLRSHGPGWIAALVIVLSVPAVVLAPVTGVLIDRYGSRRVLVAAFLAESALDVLLVPIVSPAGTIALAAAHGVLMSMTAPAILALIPGISGERRSDAGFAVYAAVTGVPMVLGPLVAGILTPSLQAPVFVAESVASLTAAVTFALMRVPAVRLPVPISGPREALRGVRRIFTNKTLRRSILFVAIVMAAGAACNVAAPYRLLHPEGPAPSLGAYQAAFALGAVVGAQLAAIFRSLTRQPAHGMTLGAVAAGTGMFTVAMPATYATVLAGAAVVGVGSSLVGVCQDCLVRRGTDPSERGRTFAAVACLGAALSVAIAPLTVPVMHLIGSRGIMALSGTLALAAGVLMARSPRLPARLPAEHLLDAQL